ncbi:MAG TPA: hypothetical protein VN677_10440 [Gemmatimonadaceae bacterium]|nr:hypothetical protein [Gemmatimonadaceae bacterium]
MRLGLWCGTVAVVAFTACGRGDRVTTKGPYATEVAQAVPMIEKATGLKFKRQPVLESRTRQQVHDFLEQRFKDDVSDSVITGEEILYRRLGLIPDTLDLRAFELRLLTEQVVGFYDPRTKVLYVVDGAPSDQVGFVVSHELVHALQDQYMNLDSIQDVRGNNDRTLAAQAVIEGQAVLVPIQAMLGPGADLPAGWDRVRDMVRQNKDKMPVFSSAPMVLQETLIFPYLSGLEFMHNFAAQRAGQEPYTAMPTSTTQILHDSAYFGSHPEQPLGITFAAPARGSVLYTDNLGEFETRLFLFQHLQDQTEAVRGAAGWRGDRYEVIRTPHGDGIAWLSLWNGAVESAQFGSDMEQVIARRFASPAAHEGALGKSYTVKGRTITLWGGEVDGHAAVLYTDLPDGESASIVKLSEATIAPEPR